MRLLFFFQTSLWNMLPLFNCQCFHMETKCNKTFPKPVLISPSCFSVLCVEGSCALGAGSIPWPGVRLGSLSEMKWCGVGLVWCRAGGGVVFSLDHIHSPSLPPSHPSLFLWLLQLELRPLGCCRKRLVFYWSWGSVCSHRKPRKLLQASRQQSMSHGHRARWPVSAAALPAIPGVLGRSP